MENFTPVSALLGGALIGISAVMLMAFNGRVAGISGIIGGGFSAAKGDCSWRAAFVAGLIIAPVLYALVSGADIPVTFPIMKWPLIIAAGVIVGVGTQMGSGCTSGHGVCGNARLSVRSLIATLTFMATGIATVYIVHHVIGA